MYKIWKFPLIKAPDGGIDKIITDFSIVHPLAIKEQDNHVMMWAIVYLGSEVDITREYQVRGVMTGEECNDLLPNWTYIDTRTYGPTGSYVVHYFYQLTAKSFNI